MELSVIVPARDEQDCLETCLSSLVVQTEPGFELGRHWELIVIDDGSVDRTHQIASLFAERCGGVRVLKAPPLDNESIHFTGKNGACWFGAQNAGGTWLLFTDADTIHRASDLSHAIREAERHHVNLLSYSPRQIVRGFWQRVVMPLVFSELASVYRMKEVNDPQQKIAAANGQFLLVRAESYFSLGGHRAVAAEVLEDVALARLFKANGDAIRFRYAPEALSTQMYRSTGLMIEGWTKNLALLFPRPLYLACWRVLDFCLLFCLPLLAFGIPWLVGWQRGALVLIWGRTLWRYYTRVARSNFPKWDVTLSAFGLPLFVLLLVRSTLHHRWRKAVVWKGRRYRTG